MKKTLLTFCAAFVCLLPCVASAQYLDSTNSSCNPCSAPCASECIPCAAPCETICDPWYLFAGVVHTGLFNDRYNVPLYNTDHVRIGTLPDNRSNNWGWQVFLGYRFIPCFALELGYVDLSKQRAAEQVPDESDVLLTGHYRDYVVPLRANLSMHFCDLSLSALFGIHYYNSHGSLSNVAGTETISRFKSGMDFNVGAAIEYRFVEWLALRVDMARYYVKHYDAKSSDYTDAVSANLVTYF
ncbi:MAG: outer membrane beta-barrel protein [Chlamydiales bacterium]|nr:outer membrane beta-barrel protein [Chlamydiales bacterium]